MYKALFFIIAALGVILFIMLVKTSVEDYLPKKEKEGEEEKK